VFGKGFSFAGKLQHKVYWAIRTLNFDLKVTRERRILQLSELDELRPEVYENSKRYKERTTRWHGKHILKK